MKCCIIIHPHVAFATPMIVADPPLLKPWNKNHSVELNDVGGCLNKRLIVNCRAELLSGFRYSSLIMSNQEGKERKKEKKRFERVYINKNGPLHRTFRGCVTERRRSHQVFGWKVKPSYFSSNPPNFPRLFANFRRLFVQVLPNTIYGVLVLPNTGPLKCLR